MSPELIDQQLTVRNINKYFGKIRALEEITFSLSKGELVILLGPSGCGKTTLLRVIAGLEKADTGTILLNGEDLSNSPPSARNFGIVFQSYALFPNMTAKDNVAYGLKSRKTSAAEREKKVREMLELVHLSSAGDQFPHQLSGGQQQRIALARALALSPDFLLLDEPLSALDAKVRQFLRSEIVDIQKSLDISTVMVTHDQEEALSMADRIVVMNRGRIEQIGTPEEIYENPASYFVADFIGDINFMDREDGLQIPEDKLFAIRPDYLSWADEAPGEEGIPVRVEGVEYRGHTYAVKIRLQKSKKQIRVCVSPKHYRRHWQNKHEGLLSVPVEKGLFYPKPASTDGSR